MTSLQALQYNLFINIYTYSLTDYYLLFHLFLTLVPAETYTFILLLIEPKICPLFFTAIWGAVAHPFF